MAAVPVVFSGVFYPKNKKDAPMVGTFVGNAAIYGLEVGGGPIEPPKPDEPPLVIWGPGDPRPGVGPIIPPEGEPPPEFPGVGPVKPFPPDGGWGYSDRTGWVFKPGSGQATPKK